MKFGAKFWFFGCKLDIFVNFKILFTCKNRLLKFDFAHRLAQILDPRLLAHKIKISCKCLNLKPKKMVKRRNLAQILLELNFLHASFYLLFKSFKLSDPIASAWMRSKKYAKLVS